MKKLLFALFVSILVLASCDNSISTKQPEADGPVVVPVDPTSPIDPVVPVDPTVDPVAPADPVDPTTPVDPEVPVIPTEPEDPATPEEDPVIPEEEVTTFIPIISGSLPTATARNVTVSYTDYDRATVAVRFLAELSSPLVTGWYDTGMAVKSGTVLTYSAIGTTVTVKITIGADRRVYYDGILGDGECSLHAVLDGKNFTYRQTIAVNFTDTNPDPSQTEEVMKQSWFTDTFLTGTIGNHIYNASGYEYRYMYSYPPDGPSYRYQYNKIWVKDRPSGFYVFLKVYNGKDEESTDDPITLTENRIFYYDSLAKQVYDNWDSSNSPFPILYTRTPVGDYFEDYEEAEEDFNAIP